VNTPVLDIQSLSIQRDGTSILSEVSWRMMPGEHWVILGPNGCGKTSLLSALTGYFMPTSGEIDLLGERYGESDWRQLRLHLGIDGAKEGDQAIDRTAGAPRRGRTRAAPDPAAVSLGSASDAADHWKTDSPSVMP
jgi:ABC-type molybdenum transport system ATPase subunit/photorepair protein PhrA